MALMRSVRKLVPKERDNFSITRSDSVAKSLIENLNMVTTGAFIIGSITLLGASIALMNIMLVSVTERTREIGTRKAIGATKRAISSQFLSEAVMITQIGGWAGILFGIIIGNVVANQIGGFFFIPWLWIIVAFVISVLLVLQQDGIRQQRPQTSIPWRHCVTNRFAISFLLEHILRSLLALYLEIATIPCCRSI
jgi:putative ABC transport system permease protein